MPSESASEAKNRGLAATGMLMRTATFHLPRALAVLGLWLLASCQQNTIPTPSRVLDLPSDVALFCMDVEFDASTGVCLPLDQAAIDRAKDDLNQQRIILDSYCNYVPPTSATEQGVRQIKDATVLPISECSDVGQQRQREEVLGPLLDIAVKLGRSRTYPCCEVDDLTCGLSLSVCKRRRLEALVTNTARGEVAVVDTDAVTPGLNTIGQIQNLRSGRPGFGFLSAGLQPDHVRTDSSDPKLAYGVVTNLGSCDLSVIGLPRVARLVAGQEPAPVPSSIPSPATCEQFTSFDQVESCRIAPWVKDRNQPLNASPGYIEIAPWRTLPDEPRALVVYPRCSLVADVNLKTGQILEGVAFSAAGPRHLGAAELASLSCPSECGSTMGTLPATGVSDPGSLPSAVSVDSEGKRVLISDSFSAALTLLDFDAGGVDGKRLGAPRQLALDFPASTPATQRGVDGVRVGPRTGAGLFAYARTRDATVRVINLDSESECETNPDPRFLQGQTATGALRLLPEDRMPVNLRNLACFPIGTPRSASATSPGIALPGAAVPTDVAFAQFGLPCNPGEVDCPFYQDTIRDNWVAPSPQLFVGDYAWILGSSGRALAVQIADRCPSPSFRACDVGEAARRRVVLLNGQSPGSLTAVSSLDPASYAIASAVSVTPQDWLGNTRRTFSSRFSDITLGPRVALDSSAYPVINAFVGTSSVAVQQSTEVLVDARPSATQSASRVVQPTLSTYAYLPTDPICDVALTKPIQDEQFRPRHLASFPDPTGSDSEGWTLAWEGNLSGLSRNTGQLRSEAGKTQLLLTDLGGLYCARGVEPGDKVFLPGCASDLDCEVGSLCYREDTRNSLPGLCFKTPADRDRCRDLSRRVTTDPNDPTVWAAAWTSRYRVVEAREAVTDSNHQPRGELRLAEIAAPEFSVQQAGCAPLRSLKYDKTGDQVIVTEELRTPALGESCPGVSVHLPGATALLQQPTACRIDHDSNDKPVRRCVVECATTADCGTAYVCAHSPYEKEERAAQSGYQPKGRCVRAPLLTYDVGWRNGTTQEAAGPRAQEVLTACFPDLLRYQVRVGDSFLVTGDSSGAAGYTRGVGNDGRCARPLPGDVDYPQARLHQPRLALGPRTLLKADLPGLACPAPPKLLNNDPVGSGWVGHRAAPPLSREGVCKKLFDNGLNSDCQTSASGSFVCLPSQTTVALPFQPASEYLTKAQQEQKDYWLFREYELFSSLEPKFSAGLARQNSCILTDAYELTGLEILSSVDGKPSSQPVNGECILPGETPPCSRRIHYENARLNLVLQLPRLTLPGQTNRSWVADEWVVPDDGYALIFGVTAGGLPYSLPVATAAGQLAQGLRTASASPDGAVFVVDQGRTGSASGLRGQIMRLVRGVVDANFLIR